ncbi:hypothetical protein [Streptomyces sp. NPDC057939]|uniref:hypothetical protein n=1 Tax=Streptomyces sp. NPDC057939 TaxID=3346284 RepID=UPI0036EA1442
MTDRIKHLVGELNEAVETMRQEPEPGRTWSWEDEHVAGLNLAAAAEALILALPTVTWPAVWFKDEPRYEAGPLSAYEERLVEELLSYFGTPPTEVLYERCAKCHLFIEENGSAADDDLAAPYVHLDRGDEADEAVTGSHDASPSGERATLAYWRQHGPEAMRERFTTDH